MDSQQDLEKMFSGFKIKGFPIKKRSKHLLTDQLKRDVIKELGDCFGPDFQISKTLMDLLEGTTYLFAGIKNINYLIWIVIFNIFQFHMNDFFDKNPGDYNNLVNYINGAPSTGNDDLDKLFALTKEKTKTLIRDKMFWNKILHILRQWIELYPQTRRIKDGLQDITEPEFINSRIIDAFCATQLLLMELDNNLAFNDLTDKLRQNSDLIKFKRCASKNFIICNDLFSLLREVGYGEGRFNFVYVKMKNKGLTVEEAVQQTLADLKRTENLCLDFGAKLSALKDEYMNEYMKDYVNSVMDCIYGNYYWSATCHRYRSGLPNFYDLNMIID